MKPALLLGAAASLCACSAANHVERVQDDTTVVAYRNNDSDSGVFRNLHPRVAVYPENCTEDCYPETPAVACQAMGENCQFVGAQPRPKLVTGFTIQWFGHASFMIETPDKQQWLLDPVSKQFDWPVDVAFKLAGGFYRNEPSWLSESQLQATDAVFYSHIHYDHFNKDDIAAIGTQAQYFTPLNFADYFPDGGYRIREMAWYGRSQLGEMKIHFVPANHFSGRIWVPFIYDDNEKTLWGGWLFEHQGKKLFFAGDTGYSAHFQEIRAKYGEIDVCLMPIASYHHPEKSIWYRYVHTTPEDALVAAQELGCKVMIPWGYGNVSWKMGDISSHSALLRLLHMKQKLKSDVPVYVLNEGESLVL
ncbi:MBL fold metallo-hydrolase [Pseudoalteromonas fenneropenaei]|uniref:MBL fold metallo-hydrolase n=1 Tax=Pseudoalteromonas fenneropenaei TaxID=1737459 RepID=A0ABV7CI13_9GAMM